MATTSTSGQAGTQVSVLFVCLGNICRSPMAEGVFRHLSHFGASDASPLIKAIDSCGTGAYHAGDPPDPRTMSVLKDNGLTSYKHKARRVRVPEDFEAFDYVLAMDDANYSDLRSMVQQAMKKGILKQDAMKKVYRYGEFGGRDKREEIVDPWYDGGSKGFEVAYEQVTRMGRGLMKHIEEHATESDKSKLV